MTNFVGDVILVLRRSTGITQEELAREVGVTQVALSRYENGLRSPDDDTLMRLADALGVTSEFLNHDFRMHGAVAADAHMRRQKTTKPVDWKRVEARLNVLRMHSSFILERTPLNPTNHVIHVDPDEHSPEEAARILRASWRMPIGPVRNLFRWIASAGILILTEDFGTHRIDGMSQWAGDHAVIVLNASMPTSRRRLTLAHELGHLVLHSDYFESDVEEQANSFAAEFLMPEHVIRPELRTLTMGKLVDLKREWGTSMQAIFERAYKMATVTSAERQKFYRQLNSRGWKVNEPGEEYLAPEEPVLIAQIGQWLRESGLSDSEIKWMTGTSPMAETPFLPAKRRLQSVS